ncbi:hypothetical protein RHAL1_P00069 (plasmid) [Beijerinckiaceae bacterium RH AL1]|nr:hypothetical protein RHAL1_P00069 [Beijerinckiaceae bacterium RH AL1]
MSLQLYRNFVHILCQQAAVGREIVRLLRLMRRKAPLMLSSAIDAAFEGSSSAWSAQSTSRNGNQPSARCRHFHELEKVHLRSRHPGDQTLEFETTAVFYEARLPLQRRRTTIRVRRRPFLTS